MEKVIKITLKPKTSFSTALRADTIFGHICWNILEMQGEKLLKDFLNYFKVSPIFLLSDGFIDGYLPNPLMNVATYSDIESKEEKIKMIDINKKFKKIELIKISDFIEICNNGYNVSILSKITNDSYHDDIDKIKQVVIKNSISRDTGTVSRDGGLFAQSEYWTKNSYSIYIKIINQSLFEQYAIIDLIRRSFEITGYGANKSTGKGLFDLEIHEFDGFNQINGSRGVLLSNCILKEEEKDILQDSIYRTEIKYGKLGESKAFYGNPFKKPLIQLLTASNLDTDKPFVGGMIGLVDADKNILDYNYGMLIPVK